MISRTPYIIRRYYNQLIWEISTIKKEVFLTFDDGPTPGVTEDVLQLLKENKAKATFFCLGKNVEKYPDLFNSIVEEGHSIGNHTYQHLNGWKTTNNTYFEDVMHCHDTFSSALFRPPYGKIKKSQVKKLDQFKIIMWSVITRDYDKRISKEKCFEIAKSGLSIGSIIVFHDSLKAKINMFYALEKLLAVMKEMEITSSCITEELVDRSYSGN